MLQVERVDPPRRLGPHALNQSGVGNRARLNRSGFSEEFTQAVRHRHEDHRCMALLAMTTAFPAGRQHAHRVRPLWHAGPMQWHWGNIGSAAAGLATLIVTVRLLWSAPDWYRTWKDRQNAERDLAREQTGAIQLERRRHLSGW